MACSASDFVRSTIAGTGTVSGPLATVTLTLLPAGTDVPTRTSWARIVPTS